MGNPPVGWGKGLQQQSFANRPTPGKEGAGGAEHHATLWWGGQGSYHPVHFGAWKRRYPLARWLFEHEESFAWFPVASLDTKCLLYVETSRIKKECLLGFLNGSIIRTQSRQINEMELRPLTLSHVFCLRFKCNAGPVWQARGKVTLESNRVMDSWQLLWAAVVLTIQLSGVFAFPISPYQAEYITSISPQSSSFSPRKSMHQEYHHYDVWCWAIEELKSNILEFAAFTA